MPIKFSIISAERLVLTKSWGVLTFEEVFAHHDELMADPQFDPDYDELGIHTDTELFTGTAQEASALGRRRVFSDMSFRAHVASRDDLYGLLRMMATYHEIEHKHERAQIFRDEESARRWLSQMRAEQESAKHTK